MVTATDWLKKAESKRSKSQDSFKAVRRRAWDYVNPTQEVEQTSVNWERIKEQNGNENRNKWEQNGNKYGNKQEQNWEQNKEQYRNKYEDEYRNNDLAKKNSTTKDNAVLNDQMIQKKMLTLTGHQKQIMRHITSHLKIRLGESYIIDILPNILAIKINASLEVTRVTLKRLTKKNLLIKLPGERGRNGCSRFNIQENVVRMCFSLFNDAPCDINLIGNGIGNKIGNKMTYSSSSSNNINNTTTMSENWEQNWEQIDFSSLAHIGFSKTQLLQLYEKQLNTPEVIQESIYHFSFGLENNSKIKSYPDPLNVLMGVLRKGLKWHEPAYISPKELTLTQLLEEKRKKKEKYDAMMKELIELEFPDWRRKLSDDDIKQIVPPNVLKTNLSAAVTAALRTHFIEKVICLWL